MMAIQTIQNQLILTLFALLFILFIARSWKKYPRTNPTLRSVAILVLGDIGRSPRMMYHAESFAKNEFETFFIGYRGSRAIPSLLSLPHVRFLYLSELPTSFCNLPFILLAPIKIVHQLITVLVALFLRISHPPEFVLVQNPPSIPTLALAWLVASIRGSKVIIDWHNLGYSILAMKLGKKDHPLVQIAKKFESRFGRSAYAHLFVTQAMHDHLVQEWALTGHKVVLHDRPPKHFHKASPLEIHDLFVRLHQSIYPSVSSFLPLSSPPYSTPFTHITKTYSTPTASPSYSLTESPSLRPERPALLVSSTSWTPDEDFNILLEALGIYERRARELNRTKVESVRLPKVLMIVTGKGPLKERYMRQVADLQKGGKNGEGWRWVRFISLWLEAEDYPKLLGSADLGISLHVSSSALDLPMKVVDMFGCGLPVCALDFACLSELVKDGKNGRVFKTAQQLADSIEALLLSFPDSQALSTLRASLIESSTPPLTSSHQHMHLGEEGEHWNTWEENWNSVMRPLILRDEDGYHKEWM